MFGRALRQCRGRVIFPLCQMYLERQPECLERFLVFRLHVRLHAPTVGTRVSAVVVGSVVLGNSAQVSSASALVSRVSNASSGVSASTAPTRTALSIVSSTAVQSSAASSVGSASSVECATRLSSVGIDAGARVPAASAPVVADVCCGPFLSVASSANISADAHIGVARVGVVLVVIGVSQAPSASAYSDSTLPVPSTAGG